MVERLLTFQYFFTGLTDCIEGTRSSRYTYKNLKWLPKSRCNVISLWATQRPSRNNNLSSFLIFTVFLSCYNTNDLAVFCKAFRDKNRGSKYFNHLSGVSEGISCLGWVVAMGKPSTYVKEKSDSSQFYLNRVLKEFKDK